MPYDYAGRFISAPERAAAIRATAESQHATTSAAVSRVAAGPVVSPVIFASDLEQMRGRGRALVIRNAGMGDVLLTTPLIRALSQRAELTVHVLTEERFLPLFEGNPYVRQVGALETAVADFYNVAIDLREYAELPEHAGHHRARLFLQMADLDSDDPSDIRLDLPLSDAERAAARADVESFLPGSGRPLVGYVWRATIGNRTWTDAAHRTMLAALSAHGYRVLVFDGERLPAAAVGFPGVADLTGRRSLREVLALLSLCTAVITPDTGLFHAAQALGVPALATFGPFPARERATDFHRLHVLNAESSGACPLQPCRAYQCPFTDPDGQSPCITVQPETVLEKLAAIVESGAMYAADWQPSEVTI